MNEAETKAELIGPKLRESDWDDMDGTKILREYTIHPGDIETGVGPPIPFDAIMYLP